MIYTKTLTLFGRSFFIRSDGTAITEFYTGSAEDTVSCTILEEAVTQLQEFADGIRTDFDLPVAPVGTAFQQSVWAALQTIPYGQTRTYGQIAAQIGKPKATRAVGGACNKNPILLLIPCHRVIGADGSLTGFGAGLALKTEFLDLEKRIL